MTRVEILEGNKLIAEFMGHKLHVNSEDEVKFYKGFDEIAFDIQYLKYNHSKVKGTFTERVPLRKLYYHESWDWLMPVIEKISEIQYKRFPLNVTISVGAGIYIGVNESNASGEEYLGKWEIVNTLNINYFAETEVQDERCSFIGSVWFGVVEFIKWYNLNKE